MNTLAGTLAGRGRPPAGGRYSPVVRGGTARRDQPRARLLDADRGGGNAAALAAIGASRLPVMVVHGDFAEWNVHYERGRLAGVIDFGLTPLDSRPYELAIARTYRASETVGAYRAVAHYVQRPRLRAETLKHSPGRPDHSPCPQKGQCDGS